MAEEFVAWHLGEKDTKFWFSEVGRKYGKITQQLVQEYMPTGFKPTTLQDFVRFEMLAIRIGYLIEYEELDAYKDTFVRSSIMEYFGHPDFDENEFVPVPPSILIYCAVFTCSLADDEEYLELTKNFFRSFNQEIKFPSERIAVELALSGNRPLEWEELMGHAAESFETINQDQDPGKRRKPLLRRYEYRMTDAVDRYLKKPAGSAQPLHWKELYTQVKVEYEAEEDEPENNEPVQPAEEQILSSDNKPVQVNLGTEFSIKWSELIHPH